MSVLSGLNESQKIAVITTEVPVLVVAGSGKGFMKIINLPSTETLHWILTT